MTSLRVACILALLICGSASLIAQTDTRATRRSGGLTRVVCGPLGLPRDDDFCLYFNGYYWQLMSTDDRISYIATYSQGIRFVLMKMLTMKMLPGTQEFSCRQLFSRFVPSIGADASIAALNELYATPENLGLPINYGLQLVAAKAAGLV